MTFILYIFNDAILDGHLSKYWMPIHVYDMIEDGQNKNLISYFLNICHVKKLMSHSHSYMSNRKDILPDFI